MILEIALGIVLGFILLATIQLWLPILALLVVAAILIALVVGIWMFATTNFPGVGQIVIFGAIFWLVVSLKRNNS